MVEFTARLADGGFADSPHFTKHVWPMLLAGASEVREVFVLGSGLLKSEVERLAPTSRTASGALSLGSLEFLSRDQRDFFRSRGTDGYLDALYQIDLKSPLLGTLGGLWPARRWNELDHLLLSEGERNALEMLLPLVTRRHVAVGFGEQGDPMFLFGPRDALFSLLE